VALDVHDARRVLDALGWERAYVVGHSWGGHLALHVAEAMSDRLLGVLSVDPLGAVGDGRWPEFDEEMFRRTPESVRERAREIDKLSMAGTADDELALEGMRLVWPAYFADPEHAPPMPALRMSSARSGEMVPSILAGIPALEAGLSGIRVPVGFVTALEAPCRSQPRPMQRTGYRGRGSRSSRARGISCGSRLRAPFARRFDGSHANSPVAFNNTLCFYAS
jgi:pimeloyl-ACP methyl ester carboxylesterase